MDAADNIKRRFYQLQSNKPFLNNFLHAFRIQSGLYPEVFWGHPGILMYGRRHKKLNLLNEFPNSVFNFDFLFIYFQAYWRCTSIQNKLACKFCSILSYLFVLQM